MSPCHPTVRFICRPICIMMIFQSSLHIGRVCGCTNARTFGSTAWAIPCCVAASASHCRAATSNARPTATDICCRTTAICRSSIWSSRRALWRIILSSCGIQAGKIPRCWQCCSGFCSSRIMRICCRRACGLDEKAACTWFSECRLLFGCSVVVFQRYSRRCAAVPTPGWAAAPHFPSNPKKQPALQHIRSAGCFFIVAKTPFAARPAPLPCTGTWAARRPWIGATVPAGTPAKSAPCFAPSPKRPPRR